MANDQKHYFCQDYVYLNPKEAGFVDLLLLLFSSKNFGNRIRFIECPEDNNNERINEIINFRRRWIIFISVVAQKVLHFLRKPMASAGFLLELWLNLLSSNGGLLTLSINLFKGKVVIPDRSSATFTSFLGNIDSRVELDRSMRPDDRRYHASLSLMAAKLSYENKAFINNIVKNYWKMEFLGFFNFWNDHQKNFPTQAFLLQDTTTNPNMIVVAFRGTEPFDADDWCVDVDVSWYKLPNNVGKVHGGFMRALGLQQQETLEGWPNKEIENLISDDHHHPPPRAYYTIRKMLREMFEKNKEVKFILTGHSLGGALAILFVSVLVLHEETSLLERLEAVYTFGQPRVGDERFGEFMNVNLRKYDVDYRRYVYCNDMVPRLPYDDNTLLFKHFGPCLYFNSCYEGQVMEEEPNKNYFSLLWVAPKVMNAAWELVRGFILPYTKGPEYREGWLLKLARVIGLVIPGLSAHSVHDYNNATRLGSGIFPLYA